MAWLQSFGWCIRSMFGNVSDFVDQVPRMRLVLVCVRAVVDVGPQQVAVGAQQVVVHGLNRRSDQARGLASEASRRESPVRLCGDAHPVGDAAQFATGARVAMDARQQAGDRFAGVHVRPQPQSGQSFAPLEGRNCVVFPAAERG
jgi:hypothetical protein